MNPIENLWHELKEYVRREVKPWNKEELVNGITQFWATVDIYKCCRYIDHLKKVLPRVIERSGGATGSPLCNGAVKLAISHSLTYCILAVDAVR